MFNPAPIIMLSDSGSFSPGSAVTAAAEVATSAITFLTGNPIAIVFIGISLLSVGFVIFSKMRKSAGGTK